MEEKLTACYVSHKLTFLGYNKAKDHYRGAVMHGFVSSLKMVNKPFQRPQI